MHTIAVFHILSWQYTWCKKAIYWSVLMNAPYFMEGHMVAFRDKEQVPEEETS